MRDFSQLVFDDTINGTAGVWYTPTTLNDDLGRADALTVQAVTTGVSGTSPTLTVVIEHSGDGRIWATAATPISAASMTNGATYAGRIGFNSAALMQFVRLKITMAGTNPAGRVKLYATGRSD